MTVYSATAGTINGSDETAGATSAYTFDFTLASGDTLFPNDSLKIVFPASANFDLSGVNSASSTTIDGSFNVSISADTVIIKRAGDGDTLTVGDYDITFMNVENTTTAGNYTIELEGPRDYSDSAPLTISAGPIASFVLVDPINQIAGEAFTLSVNSAQDEFGNTASGTVTVSFTDGGNHLSPDGTSPTLNNISVTNGTGSAQQTLVLAESGVQLRGTSGSATVDTNPFDVSAGSLSDFTLGTVSTPQVAGQAFALSVSAAEDQFGNPASGTVTVSFTDGGNHQSPDGTSPTLNNISVTNGTGSAQQTLVRAESSVQFQGSGNSIIRDTNAFDVNAGALSDFTLSTPASPQVAGQAFTINVSNYADTFGNLLSGTVAISFTDGGSHLSPNGTSPTLADITVSNGGGSAQQTLVLAESGMQLSGSSDSITRDTNQFIVNAASIASLSVTDPGSQEAGVSFNLNVSNATDTFGNPASGTVNVGFTDGQSHQVPNGESPTLNNISVSGGNGSASQTLVLKETGVRLQTSFGAVEDNTSPFAVNAGPIENFSLSDPGPQTAGISFTLSVENARDGFNNLADGVVDITFLDGGDHDAPDGTPPTLNSITVTGGSGSASQTLVLAESGVVLNGQAQSANGNDDTAPFTISPGSMTQFTLSNPTTQTAGVDFQLSVTDAQDDLGNATSGSVVVSFTDGQAHLAPNGLAPTLRDISVSGGTGNALQTLVLAESGVRLRGTGGGFIDDTNQFAVDANPTLNSLQVQTGTSGNTTEVSSHTMSVGETFQVHAAGFDVFRNYISDFPANWSVIGGIGSVNPTSGSANTTLSATTPGTGAIEATHTSSGISDLTGTITVNSTTTVDRIRIRTASNNGGVEIGDFALTADETLTLFAAGYDVGDNYIGDVTVSWTSASGNLAPTISGSGPSFIFEPTAAPRSGVIRATHSASGSVDDTGTISVGAGNPVGTVTLTPSPATLPADGSSTSQINSSTVVDSDGNAVGQSRLFTVTITPSNIGSIVDSDADGNPSNGHQVATGVNSQLDFEFQVGAIGGTANIFVSSVNGSATGNTSIAIGSMSISSISTTPTTVSQGQTSITVQMVVDNTSASTITNIDGNLIFTDSGGTPRTGEYTQLRTDAVTEIPAGSSRTLTFDVTVNAGATLDLITINGDASGEIGSTPVSVSGALDTDSWTVQQPFQIQIESVNTTIDTTIIGQTGYPVSVLISNPAPIGAADAIIDSLNLTFTKDGFDSTSYFPQFPSGSNPITVAAGQAEPDTFEFSVNVGSALADTGRFVIDAEVQAHDANAENLIDEDLNAATTDSWYVTGAPNLQILSMSPVPATSKIAGQTEPWTVRMEIRNNGSDPIDLNFNVANTFVRFFRGITNVTGQYSITQPTQLLNSGGSSLGSGVTDFLDFTVTQTGTSSGTITIEGRVEGIDTGTQNPISDDTDDGGKGQVEILSQQGAVVVLSTTPNTENISQGIGIVNTGQTFNVDVRISNGLGEAINDVVVELTSNGSSVINPPTARTISSIAAGGTGNLSFGVTGAQNPGSETFVASITDGGTGAQSGQAAPVGAPVDNDAVFNLQTPAALSVQFTQLETTQTTGDTFAVEARVSNGGQSQVSTNGQLTLTPGPNYVLAGGDSTQFFTVGTPVAWEVKAPDVPVAPETFTVRISQSPTEFNTASPAQIADSTDVRNVETQDVDLAIQSWEIISPTGATDDTVSTSQNFDFRATFTASDNLDSIRARIALPNAYNLEGGFVDDVLVPNGQTTVTWTVESPSEAVLDPRTFTVTIFGFDNGELLESPFATRQVVTVPEAILSVTNFRVAAPNPGDTQVSVGLQFVLEATVINGPQAADVEGSAFLNLDLLSSGITTTDNLTKPFTVGSPVQWNVLAPSVPRGPDPIRVSIQTIPLDENKNTQARVQTGSLDLNITTVDIATMSIDSVFVVSPDGAADSTVSTGQSFVVAAEVSWSDEAINRAASLELPVGYSSTSNITQPLDFQTNEQTVQWIVRAPETPRSLRYIRFRANGRDQSSGSTISAVPDSIGFTVVQRAGLQLNASITDPPSATDNSITADQTFTLTAELEKQGQAGVTGVDTVALQLPLPSGYSLIAGEEAIKPIVPGSSTSWRIKAPNRQDPSPVTLTVAMEEHVVQDVNTEAVTDLSPTPAERNISVITQTIGLETRVLPDNEATIIQGEDDQKLFALSFFNDSDAIIEIESITFTVRDGSGGTLAPNSVFTRLAVADNSSLSLEYGEVSPLSGSNPITITFSPPISVQDAEEIGLAVVADVATETSGTSFRFSIDNPPSEIVARVQGDTAQVDIKDENGNTLTAAIGIAPISVIEGGLETSFFNYPNPFGSSSDAERTQTTFHYNLQQDSNISIRIYTMFGELVWSRVFSAADPQGQAGKHDGQGADAIIWDGRNDKGQEVLNGVYVAVLITDSGKATTKIAVAR